MGIGFRSEVGTQHGVGSGGAREVLPLLLGGNKNLWCRANGNTAGCLLSDPVLVDHPFPLDCTFQANLVVNSRELSFTTRSLSTPRSSGRLPGGIGEGGRGMQSWQVALSQCKSF